METTNVAISISSLVISSLCSFVTILITVIGGIIALCQWCKSNDYKRSELVKELIIKVRDDEDISLIMDSLDWQKNFIYDGKFQLEATGDKDVLKDIDNATLFIRIDKTLSHFSYICYLYKRKLFRKKDIVVFDYNLRRIFDNEHIANYLYSLYHWSKSLGVECSFIYLIEYGLKKNFLDREYFTKFSYDGLGPYKSFLGIYEG